MAAINPKTSSLQAGLLTQQRGFILLTVVLTLTLLAALAFMLSRQSAMNVGGVVREHQPDAARYVAQAGLSHAQWQANQANCTGYSNLTNVALGAHSYTTTISPTSGSPVSIKVVGTEANGASYTLQRYREKVYQYPFQQLVIQPDATAGKDTFLYQWKSTWNYGLNTDLAADNKFSDSKYRSLLQFDLSALSTKAAIKTATLELYQNTSSATGGEVTVHGVSRSWTEGTNSNGVGASNWAQSDAAFSWTTAGGDYIPTAVAKTTIVPGVQRWYQWDISALVQNWVAGTLPNYGLILTAAPNVSSFYYSSDYTSPELRPKLTISYTCECGQSCGVASTLPLAHWKLDETSGPTAVDSIGGSDGSLVGNPTWSTGHLNGALDFDGVGDRVDVGPILSAGSPQITVTAWVFKRDTGDDRVITKSSSTAIIDHIFSLGVYNTTIRVRLKTTDNGGSSNYDGGSIPLNQWVHLAFTYDGAKLEIYKDGLQTASHSVTGDMVASALDVSIGNINAIDDRYWNGLLDDVRLYDRALSPAEIAGLAIPNGTVTLNSTADTTIYENSSTTNYGSNTKFITGKDNSGPGRNYRSLVKFDISTLPAGATVTSATLRLYQESSVSTSTISIAAHKVTASWNENTVTWSSSGGGSYNATPLATANVTLGTTGWKEWILPAGLIHEWVDFPATHFGILLNSGGGKNTRADFSSRENATSPQRPQLVIVYTTP